MTSGRCINPFHLLISGSLSIRASRELSSSTSSTASWAVYVVQTVGIDISTKNFVVGFHNSTCDCDRPLWNNTARSGFLNEDSAPKSWYIPENNLKVCFLPWALQLRQQPNTVASPSLLSAELPWRNFGPIITSRSIDRAGRRWKSSSKTIEAWTSFMEAPTIWSVKLFLFGKSLVVSSRAANIVSGMLWISVLLRRNSQECRIAACLSASTKETQPSSSSKVSGVRKFPISSLLSDISVKYSYQLAAVFKAR